METRQIRILIVEDNETASDSLTSACQQLEYFVTTVPNVTHAIAALSAQEEASPQIPIFDLLLFGPEVSEQDICQSLEALQALPHAPDIPTVVAAHREDTEKIVTCLEKGATGYLFGIHPAPLLKIRLDDCLEMKRLRTQAQTHLGLLQLERDMQIGRKIQTDFLPDVNKLPPTGWLGYCGEISSGASGRRRFF